MTRDDDLVTVATFLRAYEAELARGLLEASEIDVFVADENMGRIASHLTPLIGGIRLQVRREDEDLARELLDRVQNDPEP